MEYTNKDQQVVYLLPPAFAHIFIVVLDLLEAFLPWIALLRHPVPRRTTRKPRVGDVGLIEERVNQ
jgi:hypothetical protein